MFHTRLRRTKGLFRFRFVTGGSEGQRRTSLECHHNATNRTRFVSSVAFYQLLKSKVGLAFTQSPSPPRSLVLDGQTRPHRPRLVISRSTCPPLSPSPHANSFIIGTAVINTHTHVCTSQDVSPCRGRVGCTTQAPLQYVFTPPILLTVLGLHLHCTGTAFRSFRVRRMSCGPGPQLRRVRTRPCASQVCSRSAQGRS